MAGHSHWAGIKHKKGRQDKQRSKLFSKLSKRKGVQRSHNLLRAVRAKKGYNRKISKQKGVHSSKQIFILLFIVFLARRQCVGTKGACHQ